MNANTELLNALRAAVDAHTAPGAAVRAELAQVDDPLVMRNAGKILSRLQPADNVLRPVRIGILATCTIGSFQHMLLAGLVAAGALPTIEAGPYGMFELSLASCDFARDGDPDVVTCLMDESYFLPGDWDALDTDGLDRHVQQRLEELSALVRASRQRTTTVLVLHTIPLPAQVRDSFLSWRDRAAVARIWHQLNAGILALAEYNLRVAVVDLVSVLADSDVRARDDRLHRYADLPYTDGALFALAHEVRRLVQSTLGLSRKVLALDLDNTLWGGVLADVGAHGIQVDGLYPRNCYHQLQRTVRRLREQGLVLVLASKNDAELVEETLTHHPDILLRPDAFAAIAVNWAPKAGNLRHAAESLGLSTDAFVFMDDSPFERGHIADELPEVALVAADGDPAQLVRSLLHHGWFDVLELTDTDRQRPNLYQARAERDEFSTGFGSSEDYLAALGIGLVAEPANEFTIGRVAQLNARTNQFNLTGMRFDEATTAAQSADPAHLVAAFSVSDRFGDEGIVGAAWVDRDTDTWRVDNLVLSCRVLGRGVELAITSWLVTQARESGATTVEGRFVRSPKNGVASTLWERAGFTRSDDEGFTLRVSDATDHTPDWITVGKGSRDERVSQN